MTGLVTAAGRTQGRPVAWGWLALLAGPLSFGITAPALVLDDIAAALGTSAGSTAALVTVFGWGIAVGSPLAGRALARLGGRTTLALSAALVVGGALLVLASAALPHLALVLVGCALQALGGVGLTVAALEMATGPTAMGIVAGTLAAVGAVAPLAGTQVAGTLGWRAALVLPLLALLAVPAAARGAQPPVAAGPRDAVGAALLVLTVSALAVLTALPAVWAAVAAVTAVGSGLLLARYARRHPDGVVPGSVPRSARFLVACAVAFGLAVVNFAFVYAAPPLLATATGWNADQLGTALLGPYLTGGLLALLLVPATAGWRYRAVVLVLPALMVTAAALIVASGGSAVALLAGMLLGSVTASTGQGALGLRAGDAVPVADRGPALSLFTLCYLLGAAFGPAIAVAVV
jgi:DHA2 family metal-tetracycline-proton antiporter-like MFS transporter